MMKKKILSSILAATLTLSSFGAMTAFATASAPETKTTFSSDFENNDMSGFTNFFTLRDSTLTIEPETEGSDNDVLKISGADKANTANVNYSEVTVLEFDFMQKEFKTMNSSAMAPIRVRFKDTSEKDNRIFLLTYGKGGQANGAVFSNGGLYEYLTAGTWYTVKYEFRPRTDGNGFDLLTSIGERGKGFTQVAEVPLKNRVKIDQFQIFYTAEDLYIDNFSINTYSDDVYAEINKCETANAVKSVIDFYISNKVLDKKSYTVLSEADKATVCDAVISAKPYADAAAFNTALDNAIAAVNDGATVYYKWDFENNTLTDYVNGSKFMAEYEKSADYVTVCDDATHGKVAKMDFSTSDEFLVATTVAQNDIANVKYIVYDMKANHEIYDASEALSNLQLTVRYGSGIVRGVMTLFEGARSKQWNDYKTVVDVENKTANGYIYADGEYTLFNSGLTNREEPNYIPVDLRLGNENNTGTIYFDDVVIKGYKNLYEEVNEATEANVCSVLEAFADMKLIDLTGYNELDDAEKAAFAEYVKAATYADDAGVKETVAKALSILSSADELVILASESEGNVLTSATVVINADISADVDAADAKLIVASYTVDEELVDAKLFNVNSLDRMAEITATDMGVSLEGAANVKYMLWEYGTIVPLVNVKTVDALNFKLRYPGYASKAVTFSYDDGIAEDERLVELFNSAGLKATFNVVGRNFTKGDANYAAIYEGHEIANHTYDHTRMYLTQPGELNGVTYYPVSLEDCKADVDKGNEWIEGTFGEYTNGYGFVWPYKTPSARSDYAELLEYIKSTGAKYIRPVTTTGDFSLPTDWYDWSPTCHHDEAAGFVERFLNAPDDELMLFSIWGHSFELDSPASGELGWKEMETLLNKFKGRDDVWSATNMEIHDYVEAARALEVDYENKTVTNNSSVDVYAYANGNNVLIPANETVDLN